MPQGVTILGFQIIKSPKDINTQAYTIPITVPAGVTRIISFPNEFNGICDSIAVQNTDAANVATLRINNDRINTVNVIQGSPVSMSNQWIVQLEITAGAVAATIVYCEIIPIKEVT